MREKIINSRWKDLIKREDANYNEKKNGKKGLLKSKKTRIETRIG